MNKLPLTMYMNMEVFKDEDYEEKEEEIKLCNDELKYRTLEIFAHIMNKNDNEKYKFDHYKISFRDYYTLFGIDRTIKNIEMAPIWSSEYILSMFHDCNSITEYICNIKNIKKCNYDYFHIECSQPQRENKVSKSKEFLNEKLALIDSLTYVDMEKIDYRCIEYICKDLDSEELDAIIYPKEYTHFKYENN